MKSSRRQKVLNHFSGLLLFAFIFVNVITAFAGPGRTTYQAKIVKPDGYPLEATNVNFKFTILDPAGSCILYSETYSSVNMSSTSGLISFALGSGVKTYPASATTFEQVFSNITPSLSCDTGGPASYSPTATDIRKIVMQFHDGSGWQTLPAMSINAVPYAMYANEATKLNGLTSSDFVQVSTVPTCTASEALRYTGAGFTCIAVGNSVTSSTVITALGYTPADGASVTTLTSNVSSVSSTVASVSSTVFSVSSTVSSLQSSVAASFAAITSSQWTTSGSSISYGAGNVGVGTSNPSAKLHIEQSSTTAPDFRIVNSSTNTGISLDANWPGVQFNTYHNGANDIAIGSGYSGVMYLNPLAGDIGILTGNNPGAGNSVSMTERFTIKNNGNVGIGTTTPVTRLDVSGGVRIGAESTTCAPALAGTLRYNASNVEYCNGTSWQAFGVSGAGITNFNGSTSGTQSFATGTGGTAPNFTTSNGVHTLNIPLASTGSVTAGLISNTDYTTFTNKITSSAASIAQVLGYVPADNAASGTYAQKANNLSDLTNIATARTNLGLGTFATASSIDLGSASATGTLAIARLPSFIGDATIAAASNTIILSNSGVTAGTYTKVTVDTKGRVTSSSALASSDVTTALGYTPASATASTQWTTSGSAIYYNTGDVGIGTTSPAEKAVVRGGNFRVETASAVGGRGGMAVHISNAASEVGVYRFGLDNAVLEKGLLFDRDTGRISLYNDTVGTTVTERLTVLPTGNIGIGTTAPTAKLHVQDGAAVIKGTGSTLTVKKGGGTPNTLSAESVASFDNESGSGVAVNFFGNSAQPASIYMGDTANPQQGVIKYLVHSAIPTSQYMSLSTSSTERLRIDYFGNVGIGTTAPTAKLHLVSGTTSVAPLKFASGTLLTSPQSGTIEYDGANFYVTDGTNTRRAIAANTNPGTYDNVSNINSSSNITLTPTGSVVVSSTTASTNSSTGALVVKGGMGIAGDLNVAGTISGSAVIKATGYRANQGAPDAADNSTVGYAFGQDGDTGLFSPGSGSANGVLSFYSNNSEKMRLTSGGALGIGTATPSGKLSIGGTESADESRLTFQASDNSNRFIVETDLDASTSNDLLGFRSTTVDNILVLKGNGNIGIGTSAPSAKLDIVGSSILANNTAIDPDAFVNRVVAGAIVDGSGWGISSGLGGNNGLGHSWGMGTNGTDFYMAYSDGASNNSFRTFLRTSVANSRALVLQPDGGNVGIGTLTPGYALSVYRGTAGVTTNNESGNAGSAAQNRYAGLTAGSVAQVYGTGLNISNGNGGYEIYDYTAGASRMFISTAGSVGIGTINPGATLDVKGVLGTYGGALTGGTYDRATIQADDTYGFLFEAPVVSGTKYDTYFSHRGDGSVGAKLTIKGNGNVGIGTTTPLFKMHVKGTVMGTETTPDWQLSVSKDYVISNGLGAGPGILLSHDTYLSGQKSAGIASPAEDAGYSRRVGLGFWTSDFDTVRSEKMRITGTGNVGIGTTGPTQKLDVVGTIRSGNNTAVQGSVLLMDAYTNGSLTNLGTEYSSGGPMLGYGVTPSTSSGAAFLSSTPLSLARSAMNMSDSIRFYTGAAQTVAYGASVSLSEVMRITNSGNVGIGSSTPTAKFEVSRNFNGESNTTAGFIGGIDAGYTSTGAYFVQKDNTGLGSANTNLFNVVKNGTSQFSVNGAGDAFIGTDVAGTGYGKALWFKGVEASTDAVWMAKYVSSTDVSYLRVNVGDETSDYFVVGRSSDGTPAGAWTNAFWVKTDGSGWIAGTLTQASDARFKKNIRPLDNSLEKILRLEGVTYNWIDPNKPSSMQVGLIAQDVEKVYPEVVANNEDGYKSVAYQNLVAPMINAIKELYVKVVTLFDRTEKQSRQIANLEAENAKLKENDKDKDQKIKELEERMQRIEKALNQK